MVEPKWPRRLVVIRHGQSELNVARAHIDEDSDLLSELYDVSDASIPLTSEGIRQAEMTQRYLAHMNPFDVCYSSPFLRAFHTAQIVVPYLCPNKIFRDERVREKEFGILHGLSSAEIKRDFPHEYKARQRDGKYRYRLPGGENYPDVMLRVHSFFDTLVRDWHGKDVLVSTHHVPYLIVRQLFEHLDEKRLLALGEVPNCAISEYHLDTTAHPEGRMKLVCFNKVVY